MAGLSRVGLVFFSCLCLWCPGFTGLSSPSRWSHRCLCKYYWHREEETAINSHSIGCFVYLTDEFAFYLLSQLTTVTKACLILMLLNVPVLPVSNRSVCVIILLSLCPLVTFCLLTLWIKIFTHLTGLLEAYLLALNTRSRANATPYLPDMVGHRHKKKEHYGGKLEQVQMEYPPVCWRSVSWKTLYSMSLTWGWEWSLYDGKHHASF